MPFGEGNLQRPPRRNGELSRKFASGKCRAALWPYNAPLGESAPEHRTGSGTANVVQLAGLPTRTCVIAGRSPTASMALVMTRALSSEAPRDAERIATRFRHQGRIVWRTVEHASASLGARAAFDNRHLRRRDGAREAPTRREDVGLMVSTSGRVSARLNRRCEWTTTTMSLLIS